MKKKIFALVISVILSSSTFSTFATYTCWTSEMIEKNGWDSLRGVFRSLVTPKAPRVGGEGAQPQGKGGLVVPKCECNICTESRVKNEMVKLACCEQELCRMCLENIKNPKEIVQEDPEQYDTPDHPQACTYADGATQEEQNQTRMYETATPESQPTWEWKTLHGHNYFFEDGKYWRYTGRNTSYGSYNDCFWRYITPKQVRCPYCNADLG